MKKLITPFALVLALGMIAQAADTEQSVTVNTNIPSILELANDGAATVAINILEAEYLADGSAVVEAPIPSQLSVRANVPWIVSVNAVTAKFIKDDEASGKSAGDLKVKSDSEGYTTYTSLSTDAEPIAEGIAGPFSANEFTVEYQLSSTLAADGPGDYSLEVVYTVAQS